MNLNSILAHSFDIDVRGCVFSWVESSQHISIWWIQFGEIVSACCFFLSLRVKKSQNETILKNHCQISSIPYYIIFYWHYFSNTCQWNFAKWKKKKKKTFFFKHSIDLYYLLLASNCTLYISFYSSFGVCHCLDWNRMQTVRNAFNASGNFWHCKHHIRCALDRVIVSGGVVRMMKEMNTYRNYIIYRLCICRRLFEIFGLRIFAFSNVLIAMVVIFMCLSTVWVRRNALYVHSTDKLIDMI